LEMGRQEDGETRRYKPPLPIVVVLRVACCVLTMLDFNCHCEEPPFAGPERSEEAAKGGDEAISLLRHERDCFPFAAAQGCGFCAAQKLGS